MSCTKLEDKKRKRIYITFITVLCVLIIVYASLAEIQRGITAYVIFHKHIFFSPQINKKQSSIKQFYENVQFFWDIAKLRNEQKKRVKVFNPTIKPLVKEINRHQKAGESMSYSMNIYREIRWRLNFTTNTAATRLRINDLKKSVSDTSLQKSGKMQQPSDGSWGAGITVWYLRFYYSIENNYLEDCLHPQYPFSFLDRINSPEKLKNHLHEVLYNDFTKTGVFNREELDETFSAIARLLKMKEKITYTFHPQLDSALYNFVKQWQNPKTGCWGQWLIDRHGRIWKMDDVGITFHVISDLRGNVEHKDLIAKRLLEIENLDFPTGIRFNGSYNNHLNWDAVKIFRYAWPYLDSITREKVRSEISKMLKWCLTESYQSDGSFKTSDLDDTMGDAYFYGVAFLKETGYFKNKKCFWTDQNFQEAETIKNRIKAKLLSIGLNDSGLKDAYEKLK
jgi:hypothetical protein